MERLRGSIAPMITVFKDDETIDEQKTRAHVNFLISNGIQGLIVGGSSGEFFSMSPEERKRLAEVVIDEAKGRVLVFVQTGDYRTTTTIELSRQAARAGADGIVILPPYCASPTTTQILAHFDAVASKVNLPIMLYNNRGVAGVALTAMEIKALAEQAPIVGVKLTAGDVTEVHEIRHLCGRQIRIFYGDDRDVLEAILCGADGWISGLHNLIPAICRKLTDSALEGSLKEAKRIWFAMLPFMMWTTHVNGQREPHWLSLLKSGLKLKGRDVGKPRRPLTLLEQRMEAELERLLQQVEDAVLGKTEDS